jgi:tetratricopeptide (TPR) repeat protein
MKQGLQAQASGSPRGPGPASPVTRRVSYGRVLSLGIIALAAGAVYANSLSGDFVWDDHKLIVNDRAIKSWSHLDEVFTSDFFERNEDDLPYGYYRPLTTLSYLVDFSLWGLQPCGYHLTNVLLHSACSLMAALILLRLGFGVQPAVLAGLLFAVHPIHSENVAWIAGRTDLLAFFFCALAMLVHLSARGAPQWATAGRTAGPGPQQRVLRVGLSTLLFTVALMAKEMSIVLLGWLALIEIVAYGRHWRRVRLTLLPYAAIVAAYLVWRFLVIKVHMPGAPADHGLGVVLLSMGPTIVRYLAWFLWPADPNAYVQNPYVTSFADPRFLLAWLLIGVGFVLVYWRVGRDSRVRLAAGMLVVSFLPILNFVRVAAPADMGNVMAERFGYFPSFPFVALVGLFLAGAAHRVSRNRAGLALSTAAIAILLASAAWATLRRNRDWADELTFLSKTLKQNPTAVLLWGNLANYHLGKRNLREAGEAIERAAALDPSSYAVLSSRAMWFVVAGRYADAIPLQAQIVANVSYGKTAALNNLAYLYRVTGQQDAAFDILQRIVDEGHGYADVYFNLAEISRARGDIDTARRQYRRGLDSRPSDVKIARALADLELQAGRTTDAEQVYRRMLRIYPDEPRLLNNLAVILQERGDGAGALALLGHAVTVHPEYVNGRINYAQLLEQEGRKAEAAAQLEEALRRADDPELRQSAAEKLTALQGAVH